MKKYLSLILLSALLPSISHANQAQERTEAVIRHIQEKDKMVMKTVELEYKKLGDKYIIRINSDQPLVESLQDFCAKKNIKFAIVSGIGTLKEARLGFFKSEEKKYAEKTFKEPLVLSNLSGSVAMQNKSPLLHLHGTIAGENFKAYAGHILEAKIDSTAEIVLETIDADIEKIYDKKTGLNLFNFDD